MSKVIIIGIDSMDKEIINKNIEYLPTIKKLLDDTPNLNLKSVFPPDSDTAWASIYTGLNPAKHGIVLFVDPLEKASIQETDYLDVSNLKGKTFWDIAGRSGKKVCLIYPHAIYPVWPVNGFIISPALKTNDFQIFPEDFKFQFDIENFEVPKTIPNSIFEYKGYLDKFKTILENEFDFAGKMLKSYDSDLFFFYSSVLDFIQHIFWNYCDPSDPTYKGNNNPYKNSIRDFYILHDTLIGKMIKNLSDEDIIIILSDHGHDMRPINLFNINELLRINGFLFEKKELFTPFHRMSEKFKRSSVELIQKTDFRKFALSFLRIFPKIREVYTIPSNIDFNKTIAHCSDMSGLKSYTYGGIIVQREKLNKLEYEKIVDDIIKLLNKQTLQSSNDKLFDWVKRREDVYMGEFIYKYPDILFKLNNDFGAGWAINVPLFSSTSAHSFFPGTHRGDTPVIFVKNISKEKILKNEIELIDIAPSILTLLKVNYSNEFDGETFIA